MGGQEVEPIVTSGMTVVALILKLAAAAGLAPVLERRLGDRLSAWLASWLLLTAATNAAMIAASAFGALGAPFIWAWLVAAACFCCARTYRKMLPSFQWRDALAAVPLGIVVLVVMARSLIFADFTWDAQTYELVRLGLWMNYGSVLVHMPTGQINVFTNEWNGELISLVYGLAAGSIQALMFGGVEVLLVTCLAAIFLARTLGAAAPWALLVGGVVGSTPAVLGLTGALKGDLLACAGLLMAAGWSLSIASGRWLTIALIVASAALAVGSKLSTAFGIAAVLAIAGWTAARTLTAKEIVGGTIVGGLPALVFLSRKIINLAVYGDPLIRIQGEKPDPGFDSLIAGLKYLGPMLGQFSIYTAGAPTYGWLLAAGMGLSFVLALATVCARVMWRDGFDRRGAALIAGASLAVLATAYILPTYLWSFRYYLPMILVITVALLAARKPTGNWGMAGVLTAVAVIAGQISYLGWDGEINGNGSLARALTVLPPASPIDRTLIANPPLRAAYGFDKLDFDRSQSQTFAVLAAFNRPIAPFLGSRAQNRLILASTFDELKDAVGSANPDFVVVTKVAGVPSPPLQFEQYKVEVDNDLVSIARRAPTSLRQ